MKKVLIVATVESHIAQFHQPFINMLKENDYEVHIAAKNNLNEKKGLYIKNVDKEFNLPFERSPFKIKKNFIVYKQLKQIIQNENYSLIQCNTPVGGILTRIAAIKSRKKGTKVIYTAHGFHFYKGAPLKNWLVFYPIEKFFSKFTDIIVTINEEDYLIAKKHFKCQVSRIHGTGVSNDTFFIHEHDSINNLYEKFAIDRNEFNIICVGELNENKNQITLIKAIECIQHDCSNIHVYLAGNGPNEALLKKYVLEHNLNKMITFLGYTRELPYIMPCCDLLVSCSLREGLGINVIEGALCGLPAVLSKNRGHRELIKPGDNGFLFDIKDYKECSKYIEKLYVNRDLLNFMSKKTPGSVVEYTLQNTLKEVKNIYLGNAEVNNE